MSTYPKIATIADPTADEVAAAIAAVVSLMAAEASASDVAEEPATRWRGAAKLSAQGLVPNRTPAKPGWGSVERIRRTGKGGSGITGL